MQWIKKNGLGIALCFVIAVPAWLLGLLAPVVGGPIFAIVIGMITTMFIKEKGQLNAGIAFTSKKILQAAVVLLGFGMNLSVIAETGLRSLPIILSTIGTSLMMAFVLFKAMKIPPRIATLVGVGSSICGGSAIAATAPVIGADDEEIAQSISVVFLFNVIAALVFPTLGGLLGLSDYGFGLFAGTAVNDTSSVTAAASAWDAIHGSETLSIATVVKLTRTLAIIPITLGIGLYRAVKEKESAGKKVSIKSIFPMFILFFVLASVVTTVCMSLGVPGGVFSPMKTLSRFFIVMAMAAIGLHTDVKKLVKGGGKPILLGLVCWISISGVSLLMQHVLGIW
jgi:uncharacterized integral membrane protein (TIGR00698 family)